MRLLFSDKLCVQPGAVGRQGDPAFRVHRGTAFDVPADLDGFDFGECSHLGHSEGSGRVEGSSDRIVLGHGIVLPQKNLLLLVLTQYREGIAHRQEVGLNSLSRYFRYCVNTLIIVTSCLDSRPFSKKSFPDARNNGWMATMV